MTALGSSGTQRMAMTSVTVKQTPIGWKAGECATVIERWKTFQDKR